MRPTLKMLIRVHNVFLTLVLFVFDRLPLTACTPPRGEQLDLTRLRLPQLDLQKLPIKADPSLFRGLEAMIGRFEAVVDGALHAVDQYDRELAGQQPTVPNGRSNLARPAGAPADYYYGQDKGSSSYDTNDIYGKLAAQAAAADDLKANAMLATTPSSYGRTAGNTIGRSIYYTQKPAVGRGTDYGQGAGERPLIMPPTVKPTLYAPSSLFDVDGEGAHLNNEPVRIMTVDGVELTGRDVPATYAPTKAPRYPPTRPQPATKTYGDLGSVSKVTAGAGLLQIDYANGVNVRTAGKPLLAAQTYYAPVNVEWQDDSSYYLHTLVMFSVGMHGGGEEFVHWLVVNMPGSQLSKGTTVIEYLPALPADGDSERKPYIFLVYRQSKRLQSVRIDGQAFITDEQIRGRESPNWSLDRFVEEYDLGDPVAGNFYTISKTASTSSDAAESDKQQ